MGKAMSKLCGGETTIKMKKKMKRIKKSKKKAKKRNRTLNPKHQIAKCTEAI